MINTVVYSTVLKGFAVSKRIDKVLAVYKAGAGVVWNCWKQFSAKFQDIKELWRLWRIQRETIQFNIDLLTDVAPPTTLCGCVCVLLEPSQVS